MSLKKENKYTNKRLELNMFFKLTIIFNLKKTADD